VIDPALNFAERSVKLERLFDLLYARLERHIGSSGDVRLRSGGGACGWASWGSPIGEVGEAKDDDFGVIGDPARICRLSSSIVQGRQ
jgi:hypothetical protein